VSEWLAEEEILGSRSEDNLPQFNRCQSQCHIKCHTATHERQLSSLRINAITLSCLASPGLIFCRQLSYLSTSDGDANHL